MDTAGRIKIRKFFQGIFALTGILICLAVFLFFITALIFSFFPQLSGNAYFNAAKHKITFQEFYKIIKTTLYTLKIAGLSTLVAFLFGGPAAFFTAKREFFGRKFLLSLSAVPLCIPVLIAALGFVSVFGANGFFVKFLKYVSGNNNISFRGLYSETGIIIAQGFYNFPLVMKILSNAWENISTENENAARLLGSGEVKIFFTITLPELLPALASALIPAFLFCYFSFMIVLLFSAPGVSTLEVEIYHAAKVNLDSGRASMLAVAETFTALLVVIIYSLLTSHKETSKSSFIKTRRIPIGRKSFQPIFIKVLEILIFIFLISCILFFFIFPLAGIVISGFTARVNGNDVLSIKNYEFLFKSKGFWKAFETTVWVSPLTAFFCVVMSFSLASFIKISGNRKLYEILSLVPMAVSSIVLGWGLTLLFRQGNVFSLIIVQVSLFWPLAYRQIQANMNRIPQDVLNAGEIYSTGKIDMVFRVFLPWCRKSLLSAFVFCFAFSAGDTTLPIILSIPKFNTLSLYTYGLSGSYRFNTACSSGTILAVLCALLFVISSKINKED